MPWPTGTGGKGNAGVAGAVKQTDGAVGYVEQAYALQNGFTYASVKNKAGKFIAPTLASTSAAGVGVKIPADLGVKVINSPNPGAYPIASQTFIVVNKDLCKAGDARWRRSREGRGRNSSNTGSAPARRSSGRPTTRSCPRRSWRSRRKRRSPCSATARRSAERVTPPPRIRSENRAVEAASATGGDRGVLARSPLARLPDRALRWGLTVLAALILALIVYFFIRLFDESRPAFEQQGVLGFIFENNWNPSAGHYGALPLVVGTLITSALALLIGVPVAVAAALYTSELARGGCAGR